MNEIQNNIVEGRPQPRYRDRLFIVWKGQRTQQTLAAGLVQRPERHKLHRPKRA